MKKKLFKGILIFFFFGIVASHANAESAWILWQKFDSAGAPSSMNPTFTHETTWDIIEAFPRYQDCQNKYFLVIDNLKEKAIEVWGSKDVDIKVMSGTVIITYTYKGMPYKTITMSYQCLPDTVDPRK